MVVGSSCWWVTLSLLPRHTKPKKILHYFEITFATVSGEDQLLQLDEFQEALRKNLVGRLLP